MAADGSHFVPIGVIETNAPHAALLSQLNAMRPQWQIRLTAVDSGDAERKRYSVELHRDVDQAMPETGSIDVWLRVKSALMTAFPADKANAVTAIDP
jgi:hypothetical protein